MPKCQCSKKCSVHPLGYITEQCAHSLSGSHFSSNNLSTLGVIMLCHYAVTQGRSTSYGINILACAVYVVQIIPGGILTFLEASNELVTFIAVIDTSTTGVTNHSSLFLHDHPFPGQHSTAVCASVCMCVCLYCM